MKILKLLNNKNFSLLSILFLTFSVQMLHAEDSIDIWNIENNDQKKKNKLSK